MHTKVALVLPLSFATEATQDQVLVRVVHGVSDSNILEQTAFYSKDEICLGLHLLSVTEHSTRPYFPCTW